MGKKLHWTLTDPIELEHIFIIWCYLYVGEDPVFPIKYRLHCTESVVGAIDIYSDFDYSIHW